MKTIAILLIAGLPFVQRLTRDTNSHAATARGMKQFADKKYDEAQKSFATSSAIASTPVRSFNLGTSQIASGNRQAGASTIAKALDDPTLRPDALFNRGNGALAANDFDSAIRDYSDTLRLRPADAAAKRNLEIALRRKQEAQQQQQGGGNGSQQSNGPKPQPKPKPSPQPNAEQQQANDPNAEGLLRSVQQQEQEELTRMHQPSRERVHVGW